MMNIELNIITVALLSGAFAAGLVLGAFYFIALWRTVRKLPDTPRPLRLMLGSVVVRMAVVLPGFYFVMSGHWERLVMALLGFILMRKLLTRRFGSGVAA
jgi:F1/F0 ATPase, Methanosarcina type, subunit 2